MYFFPFIRVMFRFGVHFFPCCTLIFPILSSFPICFFKCMHTLSRISILLFELRCPFSDRKKGRSELSQWLWWCMCCTLLVHKIFSASMSNEVFISSASNLSYKYKCTYTNTYTRRLYEFVREQVCVCCVYLLAPCTVKSCIVQTWH